MVADNELAEKPVCTGQGCRGKDTGVGGFKTFPTSRKMANLQNCETAALHRCVLRSAAEKAATIEAQVDKTQKERLGACRHKTRPASRT